MKTASFARGSWRLFRPKTTLSLLIFLVAVFSSSAQNADYIYTNNNGTITITKYNGSGGAVIIPSSIDGLPVTSIGDGAFAVFRVSSITTSVTIADSVTSIEAGAFYGCYQLTNATLPQSLVSIGEEAFRHCGLSTVTIPSGVTNLGTTVFLNCDRLTAITVDALNPNYSSVEGVLFNKSQTAILEYPGGRTGSYQIPETVMLIGAEAFYFCSRLTSVAIPNAVTKIEGTAFASCTSLTNVIIPNSVTSIGVMAFNSCTGLTSVIFPNSVSSIGDAAFDHCTSLTGVYFEGSAPIADSSVFSGTVATVYYLPGTTGWGTTFGGRPTALWVLPNPLILTIGSNFGVKANQFGFVISWATNSSVVVEASTSLANPIWSPVSTNPLVGGSSYFSDPEWTNYSSRFHRIRSL